MALLDNGTKINTITPGFIENHSLDMGPLSDLMCADESSAQAWETPSLDLLATSSYEVQVDGVQGYDEDQIALVVLDLSNFMAQVPMILGTPTIGHIMNMIREKEIEALATPWVNAGVAYHLAV